MRVALISDIHANHEALKALSDVLAEADQVVCLGDLVGYYCQVNEVIDALRDLKALCILGNHDYFLLNGTPLDANESVKFGIDYADAVIDPEHRRWLSSLPVNWGGQIGPKLFNLVHGSPWRPVHDYLYSDSPKLEGLSEFDYDVIAFGQTHRPFLRANQRPWLVNPGSVGQSRHRPNMACAVVIDMDSGHCSTIQRVFDPETVIRLVRDNGGGNWAGRHFAPRS